MGNEAGIGTKVDELCLYVQTNDAYYMPNSLVQGSVFIDVFRPIMIYTVELRLKGTERIKWEETRTVNQPGQVSNHITEKMKDKQVIFRIDTMLQQINAVLSVGQYQFPFAFQMPDRIPGSFSINHFGYDGRIRYTLTSILNCERPEPIKFRNELIIRQRPTVANYNEEIKSDSEVCICCANKGRSIMVCRFQSDTYQPGNDAVLLTSVDNTICSANINNFSVALKQNVIFKKKSGKNEQFDREIRTNSFPGMAANTSNIGSPQLMSIRLQESSSSQELIQPSVQGMLINCNYCLEVKPVYEGPCPCCSTTPVVTVPLCIYAPNPHIWREDIPQGFNPKMYDVHQIIVPMPSMRIDFNVSGAPSLNSSINTGLPSPSANVHVNPGLHNVRMDVKMPNVEMPSTNVHMSGPGANVHVSGPSMGMPSAKVGMSMPGAKVNVSGPR